MKQSHDLGPQHYLKQEQPKQEQQLELMQTTAIEFEQALNTLSNLTASEHEDSYARWPANLQSLCELMRCTLADQNVKHSEFLSKVLVTALSTYMGGRDIYIPNGERLKDALRDIQIWREFKGNNIEALSRKYKMTERRVTQIIKFQRAAFVARNQRSLF